MKKFIEHLRNQAIAGNKIIVVGNKDLERDYGDIIDGYDIVIRFSLSNYLGVKSLHSQRLEYRTLYRIFSQAYKYW